MTSTSGSGLTRSRRLIPELLDISNEFGQLTILQLEATDQRRLLNAFIIGDSVEKPSMEKSKMYPAK